MTKITDNIPFLTFFTDLLEVPELGDNLIIVCERWQPKRPQPRVDVSKPPAKRGVPGKPMPTTRTNRKGRAIS